MDDYSQVLKPNGISPAGFQKCFGLVAPFDLPFFLLELKCNSYPLTVPASYIGSVGEKIIDPFSLTGPPSRAILSQKLCRKASSAPASDNLDEIMHFEQMRLGCRLRIGKSSPGHF